MYKKIFYVMLFCLALALALNTSTASTAQAPELTATPEWVKPSPGRQDLPPFLNPTSIPETAVPSAVAEPSAPDFAFNWCRMVFQSYRDGNWEIYSSHEYDAAETNLTNRGNASDARPQLSKGMAHIVFNGDPGGTAEIYVMNADGSGMANLTTNSNRLDYAGAWSPDGSRIAYVSNVHGAHRADPVEVYVMNADGSAKTRLTYTGLDNDGPRWSPDGIQITWRQYQEGIGPLLMAMNADGSNPHAITPPLPYLGYHAWSPDGSFIAFDYDADGDGWNELAVMNADGTGLHTVYDPGCDLCDAWMGDWSGNADWLLYSRVNYVVSGGQLYLLSTFVEARRVDGANSQRLTTSGYDMNPSWQSVDLLPPVTQVDALPEYSPASGLAITWSGIDQGPAGIGNYWFQFRLGPDGVWEDMEYVHGRTSLFFSSETYDTVYFRSRAIDYADNLEPWPAGDGDTGSKLYSWLFGGSVRDARGHPVPGAGVSTSPAPWEASLFTGRLGEFLVHLKAEGAFTLNASHVGYGTALPASIYILGQRSLDRFLPPTENMLENGNFEANPVQLTGWNASGNFTSTVVTGFSGQNAAGLGYECGIPCLTEPEILSTTSSIYSYPKIAAGEDGILHVLHVDPRIFYISRATDGTWSDSFQVGEMASGDIPERSFNDIAVDAQGGVHFIWSGGYTLKYRERSAVGTWSATTDVTPGSRPAMAVDDLGGVHLIYSCYIQHCPGTPDGVYYIERSPSGIWASPVLLNEYMYGNPVDIEVGVDHTVHFLYSKDASAIYRSKKPDGTLTDEEGAVYTNFHYTNNLYLKLDKQGILHALLIPGGGAGYAFKEPGKPWSATDLLDFDFYYGDMTVDLAGRVHVYGVGGADTLGRYVRIERYQPEFSVIISQEHSHGGAITVDLENNLHLIWLGFEHMLYRTTPHAPADSISAISQVVTIPDDIHKPTLSFMYRLWGEAACHSSEYIASVSDALTTTQVWSEQDCGDWSHAWIDLSPWTSQTVTVTFALHQAAGEPYVHLYLDDISLGAWLTPIITAAAPDNLEAAISSTITISGQNFIATPSVRLNDIIVADVEWVDEHTLRLHLPAGLPPGIFTIRVTNPGGQEGICPSVLKVGKLTYMPIAIRPAAP